MRLAELYQFINPLIFTLFAGAFYGLSRANRSLCGAQWFAVSYLVGAGAFVFDILRAAMPDWLAAFGSNTLYGLTGASFAAGMITRYRQRPPAAIWFVLAAALMTSIGAYGYFYFAAESLWPRIYAINIGAGSILMIALFAIARAVRKPIDRAIFVIHALMTLQFFVRPVIVERLTTTPMTMDEYTHSLFFLSFHLIVGVIAIAMATALIAAMSLETFADLTRRSARDAMSGLLNRRGFEAETADAVPRLDAAGAPAAVILADIDGFKSINDRLGHAFGDLVLMEAGALFQAAGSGGRVAGRLGGDEYALFLPHATLEAARACAENLKRKFADTPFLSPSGERRFTASFGVSLRQPSEPLYEALRRADEAVFVAKSQGGDRVKTETDLQVSRLEGALNEAERRSVRGQSPLRPQTV